MELKINSTIKFAPEIKMVDEPDVACLNMYHNTISTNLLKPILKLKTTTKIYHFCLDMSFFHIWIFSLALARNFEFERFKHIPGSGVVQSISLGSSNCTGLRILAASASVCRGLADNIGIGGGGGRYLEDFPPLELPLFVDEASSSF